MGRGGEAGGDQGRLAGANEREPGTDPVPEFAPTLATRTQRLAAAVVDVVIAQLLQIGAGFIAAQFFGLQPASPASSVTLLLTVGSYLLLCRAAARGGTAGEAILRVAPRARGERGLTGVRWLMRALLVSAGWVAWMLAMETAMPGGHAMFMAAGTIAGAALAWALLDLVLLLLHRQPRSMTDRVFGLDVVSARGLPAAPGAGPAPPAGRQLVLSPVDAFIVVLICFGWYIAHSIDVVAGGWREMRFDGNAAWDIVVTDLGLAACTLLLLRVRGVRLGGLVPQPSLRGSAVGVALYVAMVIAHVLVTAPFHGYGSDPIVAMTADMRVPVLAALALALVNGTYEELFLLGVLANGLGRFGAAVSVGVPLLVRTSYHLYQGPVAALGVAAIGLVLGLFYQRSRWLWPAIFAHILADALAFVGHTY